MATTESDAQRLPGPGGGVIPRLRTLLRLLPSGSASAARLRAIYPALARATPHPTIYTYKNLARYLATIRELRGVVAARTRWADLASDAWFAWLCHLELPAGQTISTGFERQELDVVVAGFPPFHYRQVPLAIEASTADLGLGHDLDLVTSFELIEHLQFHPAPFLGAVNDALRLGGRFVVTTPNVASWATITRLLDGRTPHLTPLYGGPMDHRKEYTVGEMRTALGMAGFEVERVVTFDCYEGDLENRLGRLGAIAYHALALKPRRVRNLVIHGGSTMLIQARKTGTCDVDALRRIRL